MRRSLKRVLVTGASGFIGANLIRRLLKLGHEVHILTRKDSNKWRIKELLANLNEHKLDLLDFKLLKREISEIKPDEIYHLAAYGGYPFQKDPLIMVRVNILKTVHLLESLKEVDYKIFINIGSSSEYGFKRKPMKENDTLKPTTIYAATKAGATHICDVYAHLYNKPITTVRPFSVYGPFEEPSRFIPQMILYCLTNRDLNLTKGQESRDYIHVTDFIDGLFKIASVPQKVKGKVINLGSGRQYSVRDIALMIKKLTGSKSRLLWGTYQPRDWDTNYWQADNSLALKLLGWKPKLTIEKGLVLTIDWFKKNRHLYA